MINLSAVDKSSTNIITDIINAVGAVLNQTDTHLSLLKLQFLSDAWFLGNLKKQELIPFLKFAIEGREAETLESLTHFFKNPATFESALKLCLSLFGLDSVVIFNEKSGFVGVEITNANLYFSGGLVNTPDNFAILSESDEWILVDIFASLGDSDLNRFLLQFLPIGVSVNVNLQ